MHNLLISASPLLNKIIKLIMKQKKVVNKLRATLSTQISFQLLIMLMLKNLKYFSLSCISTHARTHTHTLELHTLTTIRTFTQRDQITHHYFRMNSFGGAK